MVLFGLLAWSARTYPYLAWDLRLTRALQQCPLPGMESLMRIVSIPGNGWMPYFLVAAVSLLLVWRGLGLEALVCAAGVGLGASLNATVKLLVARPRPPAVLVRVLEHPGSYGFPSGHVSLYVEFLGLLCFLLLKGPLASAPSRRPAVLLLGALILLVGCSRVYLGVHWPSDVLGGYLLGGLWLEGMLTLYGRLKRDEEAERRRP